MTSPIGAVYLAVLPDLSGFGRETSRQLAAPVRRAASQAGAQASGELGKSGGEGGQRFGSRAAAAAKPGLGKLKGAATLAGAAAGTALAAGVSGALSLDSARATMSAQLGLTRTESAQAGKVAGSLYARAYGSSLEEVSGAVTSVIRNIDGMRGASRTALEATTGRALTLAKVMDADVGDTTRAVSQLLRTGLAKNASEAFDLITKGAQQGADKGGDLLDTVNEYSVQFQKLGLTGPAAMGLISQAIKAGARDSDVAADALKEFSIRAVDGSKTSAAGFKALGLDARQMTATFAAGGPAAAQGLQLVLSRLRGIKDPADRSAAAVALFGTQAEDLGGALLAMDPSKATAALGNFQGATDSAGKTLQNTSSARFEAFKRGMQAKVTGAVLDYGVPALNLLQRAGQALNISPSGLIATGAAVGGIAIGAKAVAATYGAAKTVVGGTTAVLKGAGGAWNTLRLRAMYAGETARKAGAMIKTAALATVRAGKAAFATAVNLGRMAAGYVRTGVAAAASAARQLAAAAAAGVVRLAVLSWTAAQWLLNAAMSANPVGLVVLALVALGAALVVAWTRSETFRAIVMAVWNAIKTGVLLSIAVLTAGITAGWNWIRNTTAAVWGSIGGVLTGIWKVIWTVAKVYIAIYRAIFLGAWWAIRNGTAVAWAVIKAVLIGTWKVIWTVAKVYIAIYRAIFQGAWWAIKTTASVVWGAIKGVVLGFLGQMQRGFWTGVRAIQRIWSGIRKAAADPVRFVVETVYSGGIKRIWDALADRVGLPKLPAAPKFAMGGVLDGYRPGHDSVTALLSPGEAVLRPEAVRFLGAGWIHSINKAARQGQLTAPARFAKGGIVGRIGGAVGGFLNEGKDLFGRGVAAAARAAFTPILAAAESSGFTKTGFGKLVAALPRTIVNGVLRYFTRNENRWLAKLGPTKVVRVALSQLGQGDRGRDNDNKYNDEFGWPAGTKWCANFVSWVIKHAGAQAAYKGYPTAAASGYLGMRRQPGAPRPGDLGIWPGRHIGIVEKPHGMIEGNHGPRVVRTSRMAPVVVRPSRYAKGGIVRDDLRAVLAQNPEDRSSPMTRLYRALGPGLAAKAVAVLSKLQMFGTGGVVTRPTLGLLGEAGPEAVIPLTASRAVAALTPVSTTPPHPEPRPIGVRVFIGDTELRDLVRVEIDQADAELSRALYARAV
ncbi:phage tail tape measure protein [Actinomadura graeca]|uniref:Phage tail tape measure protein n=1 Tax=Actinomadura graeca TaxID=2750812 RepID=A0ABX8QLZ4_9ACTN|nr:phage tail tape measure protein [Actinomadura graeca]QXJ19607.1 phage tail tape measure protein [Actinomadura graeca]